MKHFLQWCSLVTLSSKQSKTSTLVQTKFLSTNISGPWSMFKLGTHTQFLPLIGIRTLIPGMSWQQTNKQHTNETHAFRSLENANWQLWFHTVMEKSTSMSQTKLQHLCEVSVAVTNQIPAWLRNLRVSSSDLSMSWQNLMYFWACRSIIWWQNLRVNHSGAESAHTHTLKNVCWLITSDMFAPLTNWLTRQWDNQGSHFNAGWPPRIMTSSMVTLRPPSHLKLNQCKGKWLNKKAGRTTCTIIASMNVKNKHTSNNNIIRSSWLHTKLHDLVTDPELQTLWTALGRKFSTTWVAGAFWSWAVTFSFIKSGWKMNGQWLLMNQWDPILPKGPLKCFRAFQRIQVRGHQLMAQFGSFLRLQPIDKLHDSRLQKTADWQQRPWAQINSQYMISGLIRLCQTSFIQNVFAFSSKHWTENQSPTEVNWQSCWLIGDHVAKACNASETSVQGSGPHKLWITLIFLFFYSTIQQTTADYSRQ